MAERPAKRIRTRPDHRLVCHRNQCHSAEPKNRAPQQDPQDHTQESAFRSILWRFAWLQFHAQSLLICGCRYVSLSIRAVTARRRSRVGCWKLVSGQASIRFGSARRRHRFPSCVTPSPTVITRCQDERRQGSSLRPESLRKRSPLQIQRPRLRWAVVPWQSRE